jgi:hypothetical protein
VLACALKSGTPWVAVELALCVGAKPHRVQLDADGLAFALSAVVKMDRAPSVQTCVLPALHLDPARIELLALRLGDPWKPSLHSQLSARLRLSSPPSVALGFVRRVSPSLVESALDANLGAFPASYPGLLGLLELVGLLVVVRVAAAADGLGACTDRLGTTRMAPRLSRRSKPCASSGSICVCACTTTRATRWYPIRLCA